MGIQLLPLCLVVLTVMMVLSGFNLATSIRIFCHLRQSIPLLLLFWTIATFLIVCVEWSYQAESFLTRAVVPIFDLTHWVAIIGLALPTVAQAVILVMGGHNGE